MAFQSRSDGVLAAQHGAKRNAGYAIDRVSKVLKGRSNIALIRATYYSLCLPRVPLRIVRIAHDACFTLGCAYYVPPALMIRVQNKSKIISDLLDIANFSAYIGMYYDRHLSGKG
jgi:hypothetical protein